MKKLVKRTLVMADTIETYAVCNCSRNKVTSKNCVSYCGYKYGSSTIKSKAGPNGNTSVKSYVKANK